MAIRAIGKRKLKTLEHVTPDLDLFALRTLVLTLAEEIERIVPMEIAEIGSWVGESAAAMLAGLDRSGIKGRITCVDTWQGNPNDYIGGVAQKVGSDNVFALFKENLKDEITNGTVCPFRMRSKAAAELMASQGRTFDLVFIDAGHTYEECSEDIAAWLPLVKEGGVICGHDLCDGFPGVEKAVREHFMGQGKEEKFGQVHLFGATLWAVSKKPFPGRLES